MILQLQCHNRRGPTSSFWKRFLILKSILTLLNDTRKYLHRSLRHKMFVMPYEQQHTRIIIVCNKICWLITFLSGIQFDFYALIHAVNVAKELFVAYKKQVWPLLRSKHECCMFFVALFITAWKSWACLVGMYQIELFWPMTKESKRVWFCLSFASCGSSASSSFSFSSGKQVWLFSFFWIVWGWSACLLLMVDHLHLACHIWFTVLNKFTSFFPYGRSNFELVYRPINVRSLLFRIHFMLYMKALWWCIISHNHCKRICAIPISQHIIG